MDISLVDPHTPLEETGSEIDWYGLEFRVFVPEFVKKEGELLAVTKGGDGHETSATSPHNVRDES